MPATDQRPPDITTLIQTIAVNVRARRHNRHLTRDQLADMSGIGVRTVDRLECGREVSSLVTVAALARALDVPITDLLAPLPRAA